MSDLTVLMPTFNRAEVLRTTLEAMCQVRRGELRVRFVVIDNASTDGTPELLRELAGRLPLTVLREPLAGKCNALNRALRDAPLGELVVFTDDDVTPDPSWFEAIVAISQRWPQHAVFGGRIVPGWPSGVKQPFWALGQIRPGAGILRAPRQRSRGSLPRQQRALWPQLLGAARGACRGGVPWRPGPAPHAAHAV